MRDLLQAPKTHTLLLLQNLRNIFTSHLQSGGMARRRLQMVLMHDRMGLPQGTLDAMKDELLQVISKYLVIDPASVEVEMHRSGDALMLVSNVLVKEQMQSNAT